MHRAIPIGSDAGIDLIDVDLQHAPVRLRIITDSLRLAHGRTFGTASTPAEWQARTHALAVVNGGFFGNTADDERTEIMGLLVQEGAVRHAASIPHAALLLDAQDRPQIAWAASRRGIVTQFNSPERGGEASRIQAQEAVGCGPMLVWNGQVHVTDHDERLVSPGAQPRTFAAIDGTGHHFVMGIASAAEYTDIARFLVRYFPDYDHTRAGRAFCLDGGSSSQLTYRLPNGSVESPRMTGATMPVVLAVFPR